MTRAGIWSAFLEDGTVVPVEDDPASGGENPLLPAGTVQAVPMGAQRAQVRSGIGRRAGEHPNQLCGPPDAPDLDPRLRNAHCSVPRAYAQAHAQ